MCVYVIYISAASSEASDELSEDCCLDFLFFGGAVSSSSEPLDELPELDEPEPSPVSLELSDSLSEDELESDEDPEPDEPDPSSSPDDESDSLSELDEESLDEPDDDCRFLCF